MFSRHIELKLAGSSVKTFLYMKITLLSFHDFGIQGLFTAPNIDIIGNPLLSIILSEYSECILFYLDRGIILQFSKLLDYIIPSRWRICRYISWPSSFICKWIFLHWGYDSLQLRYLQNHSVCGFLQCNFYF